MHPHIIFIECLVSLSFFIASSCSWWFRARRPIVDTDEGYR
jgi:hypothetical protein